MDQTAHSVTGHQPARSIRHFATRLRRVASMGMAEAGYRGWQASAKWIDRRTQTGAELRPISPSEPQAPVAVERFFPGVSHRALAGFARRFPGAVDEIRREAETLLEGQFDLLGYRGLRFGSPIDWQLDPVHARRAPLNHWSQIDPLDRLAVGDSKVAWELNRHQWIVRLAQAFALTGDRRYEAAAVEAIDQWIEANPVGRGLNWASSLEVAFRLVSWTWVLALLGRGDEADTAFGARMRASIHAHATHVRKYLSYYFSPNTHLTGEALGLFYAGLIFPSFRDAANWCDTGMRILIEQADVQIGHSGIYFEHSTCYQRYTCEFYIHLLLLAQRAGLAVPPAVQDRLVRMLDFLVALQRPDGSMPLIGDTDDGWLMPMARREPADFRGVFAVAAAMFARPDYAAAAGGAAPEVSWLLGPDGVTAFDRLVPAAPASPSSRIFKDGYAVMRSGWDRDAHQLILDVGPLGCPVSSGHGHEDLLALQLSVFGDAAIVDPGTYGYTAEPEWRDYFRGAAAHSTVTIDGAGHSHPAGPFAWRRRPRAVLRDWMTSDTVDLADAAHNAYAHLPTPVSHRRRVAFIKPAFWVVIDDLTGAGAHTVEATFQFAPLTAELVGPAACKVVTERGALLWVLPLANVPLAVSLRCGDEHPRRGWFSSGYGQRQPAPALTCSAQTTLPVRIITVLFPTRDADAPPPSIRALGPDDTLLGVRIAGHSIHVEGDRIVLDHD